MILYNGTELIISDFVYEAFGIAKKNKIPSFGVCHFPWDWFLSKLYPSKIPRKVFKNMEKLAQYTEAFLYLHHQKFYSITKENVKVCH